MKELNKNHFYKIYVLDVDNILNLKDDDINEYFPTLCRKINAIMINREPKEHFYICCNDDEYVGWMPGESGYEYFIDYDYKYGGEYTTIQYLRKKKLEKIENVNG